MDVAAYFDTLDYHPNRESDAEARAWLAGKQQRFGHFIDGRQTKFKDAGSLVVVEPATGGFLAKISLGDETDINAAVKAARAAQPGWAGLSDHERARKLYALARLIQRNARLFAVLESLDNGKPVRETRDIDVPLAARHFYHHAGWAQIAHSAFPDHDPVGVVGQIIPWNFPLLMLAWKVAPALALGNTVVLKPAELTPLSALLFADLAARSGLPDGVLNIVTGDGTTGSVLAAHNDIDKIAFTGSTAVGRQIRKSTAGSGKSLTLELGGKSPFIVFDDADLDAALEGVVDAIWFNQGQVCCAGSRILAQESVAECFLQRLRARMDKLRIGHSLDKTIDMGAIVSARQLARIRDVVAKGIETGARSYQPRIELPAEGFFYPPTLISGVQPTAELACEEIFGPVVVAMSFRTHDEAIKLANHSRYGLAASIWSESVNLALEVAAQLEAGVVWINGANQLDAAVGFGGKKESGFGREGGREGCFDYLKPTIWAKNPVRSQPKPTLPKDGEYDLPTIDRTAKLFIGGKQTRPDGAYVTRVVSSKGAVIGEVPKGNRKDIRNAVEAARGAASWAGRTAYNRAQILYYLGENLSIRSREFAERLRAMTGTSMAKANGEVAQSISRLFTYAAWADKFDGAVHLPPLRGVALAIPEPLGVVGAICPPEAPLLGLISVIAPLIATGNRIVVVPSEPYPLSGTDFCSVLESSDVPNGVVNIVTGSCEELAQVLSAHNDVDAVWAFGSASLSQIVESGSIGNLKRTFVDDGRQIDWHDPKAAEGALFLRRATDIKNIWAPYGE